MILKTWLLVLMVNKGLVINSFDTKLECDIVMKKNPKYHEKLQCMKNFHSNVAKK